MSLSFLYSHLSAVKASMLTFHLLDFVKLNRNTATQSRFLKTFSIKQLIFASLVSQNRFWPGGTERYVLAVLVVVLADVAEVRCKRLDRQGTRDLATFPLDDHACHKRTQPILSEKLTLSEGMRVKEALFVYGGGCPDAA